jgi:hypothetical protein
MIRDDLIHGDDVLPLVIEACPSFSPSWLGENADASRLGYVDAGDFAHHLVKLATAGRTDTFGKVFTLIERFHVEGDEYVRQLATIGYLEALQNVSEPSPGQAYWEPYLLPESRRWWDALNAYWAGDPDALDRVARGNLASSFAFVQSEPGRGHFRRSRVRGCVT